MPVLLLPYFVLHRRWKVLAGVALGSFLAFLMPALIAGFRENWVLHQKMIPYLFWSALDKGSMITDKNQSLFSMLFRFFSSESWYRIQITELGLPAMQWVHRAAAALLYGLCLFGKRRPVLDYALLSVTMALLNPNAWAHAYLFLLPGTMVLLHHLLTQTRPNLWVLLALVGSFVWGSLSGEAFTRWWASDFFELSSNLTFSGLLVFCGLLYLRWASPRRLTGAVARREALC